MEYREIKQLMDKVDNYITRSKSYIEADAFDKLIELETEYANLSQDLQEVPADKMQMFSREMDRFNMQLGDVRDAMVKRRDEIRSQIGSIEDNSGAAKAYMKSSMVSNKKDD